MTSRPSPESSATPEPAPRSTLRTVQLLSVLALTLALLAGLLAYGVGTR